MYFRVEDENGLSPNLREYGWNNSYNKPVNACDADTLIANEIRDQVNNCNNRRAFSYSKSLGVVLFKYNYIADNPIHLIPVHKDNFVNIDVINEKDEPENYSIQYSIRDLGYPIKQYFDNRKIILKNFSINVDNDIQLDKYLRNYTNVGKKKIATCEKDREVIIRHIVCEDYIIREEIDAVYLIYALQYKFRFLNHIDVVGKLVEMFYKEIKNRSEYKAFRYLVLYLKDNWDYEEQISKKILEEKRQAARVVYSYDAYFLALDIMYGSIEEALNNCDYYLPYRVIDNICNIFYETYNSYQ